MTVLALAYSGLPDINETPPLDSSDTACFDEMREVLRRHGKLDRFGLALLHTHFEVGADEVLVESCDHDQRVLTMSVVPARDVDRTEIVETMWRLTDDAAMVSCVRACVAAGGGHNSKHVTVK